MVVWGGYLSGLSLILMLAPNTLLGIAGLPPVTDVWIRVLGMVTVFLAYFSFMSSSTGDIGYMRWATTARFTAVLFLATFVLAGWAGWRLISLGVVDFAGALYTRWALAKDARS
jgi:hypothetical protein